MLGIILCDDDRFILGIEEEKIKNLIKKHLLDAQIVCASTNYKEVIKFIDTNPGTYLCFVDLDFGAGRLNGIDIAKLIKSKNAVSKIVFVTNHHEMALKVLKSGVEPFGFIEKSTDMEGMNRSYLQYINLAIGSDMKKEADAGEEIILQITGDEQIALPISNILYVEAAKTVSHCIVYHTLDGSEITVRDTVENVLSRLGDDFMKSHRSVIVNKKYVVGLEDGMVKFANGILAACSFRQRNEIKEVIYGRK